MPICIPVDGNDGIMRSGEFNRDCIIREKPVQHIGQLRCVQLQAGVEVDWDNTDIGEWTPATRYGFTSALPCSLIEQMTLVPAS